MIKVEAGKLLSRAVMDTLFKTAFVRTVNAERLLNETLISLAAFLFQHMHKTTQNHSAAARMIRKEGRLLRRVQKQVQSAYRNSDNCHTLLLISAHFGLSYKISQLKLAVSIFAGRLGKACAGMRADCTYSITLNERLYTNMICDIVTWETHIPIQWLLHPVPTKRLKSCIGLLRWVYIGRQIFLNYCSSTGLLLNEKDGGKYLREGHICAHFCSSGDPAMWVRGTRLHKLNDLCLFARAPMRRTSSTVWSRYPNMDDFNCRLQNDQNKLESSITLRNLKTTGNRRLQDFDVMISWGTVIVYAVQKLHQSLATTKQVETASNASTGSLSYNNDFFGIALVVAINGWGKVNYYFNASVCPCQTTVKSKKWQQ